VQVDAEPDASLVTHPENQSYTSPEKEMILRSKQ
jgi:hypothetical protein